MWREWQTSERCSLESRAPLLCRLRQRNNQSKGCLSPMTIEGCALSHERCTAILISDAIEGCALYNERCTAILISDAIEGCALSNERCTAILTNQRVCLAHTAIEGCALSNEQQSKGVSLLCDPMAILTNQRVSLSPIRRSKGVRNQSTGVGARRVCTHGDGSRP